MLSSLAAAQVVQPCNINLVLHIPRTILTAAILGISLAFSRFLLEKGCSVIIGDLRLSAEAETLLQEFPHPSSDGKPSAIFQKTNVVSWPQLTSLWDTAVKEFSTIDIVVPGAGVYDPPWSNFWQPPNTQTNPNSKSRDAADADPGHYGILDVNLVSPIRLSQLAISHWTQKKQPGCLVHLGSMAGHLTDISTPLYFASKHGLHGFVRSLADLKKHLNIRVSAVAPGPVKVCFLSFLHNRSIISSGLTDQMFFKTGLWSADQARADEILDDCRWITIDEVVQAMYELVVNEEMGDGTILEVTPKMTRVVPEFNSPPPPSGIMMPALDKFNKELLENLKSNGLQS